MDYYRVDYKEVLETAHKFLEENLLACCRDLKIWDETAVLPEGKFRELSAICKQLDDRPGHAYATCLVKNRAVLFVLQSFDAKYDC